MEIKNCQNCKKDFEITPDDFGFYEKIKVPPPTFCPRCRMQRRWAWRNNMSLYSRKCDLCQKSVVSIYSHESGLTVYCNKCWWSDNWDPKSYGVDYDFSKPFFTQFRELVQRVPHMAIVNDDGIASKNCEYTHDWWFSKNCYMCFTGWHVENVMYSYFVLAGKDIMDCMTIRSKSEKLYDCYMTSKCYNLKYSSIAKACLDSSFLYDCIECKNCFMCTGLRNKKYFFKNKQYEKDEYEKIVESYNLNTYSGVEKARLEYSELILKHPRRFSLTFRCLNSFGDIISDSKMAKNCFVVKNAENLRFSDFVGDTTGVTKDSYDLTTTGGVSESYECVVGDHSQLNLFGLMSVKSQDIRYNQHCHNVKYTFGCVSLRNTNYSILNKQYTKEEYEKLLPKIIEHMNTMPYVDKNGIEYRYGEYFPTEQSYFGYNESCAMEEFPLTKNEVLAKKLHWQDNQQKTEGKETMKPENIPDMIEDVQDDILDQVLSCVECTRNYKLTQNELIFYRMMKTPLPRKCFFCRHNDRVKRRNPFKLWHRQCMCEIKHDNHEGRCEVKFETSYTPERPEIVYCEKCYQNEVY